VFASATYFIALFLGSICVGSSSRLNYICPSFKVFFFYNTLVLRFIVRSEDHRNLYRTDNNSHETLPYVMKDANCSDITVAKTSTFHWLRTVLICASKQAIAKYCRMFLSSPRSRIGHTLEGFKAISEQCGQCLLVLYSSSISTVIPRFLKARLI
jgi:hypothetical protein